MGVIAPRPVVRSLFYLSQVLGKPIRDENDEPFGDVQDVVAQFTSGRHPAIKGLVARQGKRDFYLDMAVVDDFSPAGARLKTFTVDLRPFERRQGEVLLRHDVLDKQLIDVDGHRVVRANDLQLAKLPGLYRLVGVDVSLQGILRRLGPQALVGSLASTRLIDWADVESFSTDVPTVRLRVPHAGVARLHPVQIAQIMEDLAPRQSQEVLNALDTETAAETIQEMDPDDAADLLEMINQDRAADILDEMEPDDAADVLAEMTEDRAAELLELMEPDEAADVRHLMTYEGDTAAGLMTTECVVMPEQLTVDEAIARLRAMEETPDHLYDIYLVGSKETPGLTGVLSLRDLVLASPDATLRSLAQPPHPVSPDTPARDAAATMAEYNLVMLPVVNENGEMLGVVSVDDAMDVLLPEPRREWLASARIFRS